MTVVTSLRLPGVDDVRREVEETTEWSVFDGYLPTSLFTRTLGPRVLSGSGPDLDPLSLAPESRSDTPRRSDQES